MNKQLMEENHYERRIGYIDFFTGIGTLAGGIGGYYLGKEIIDYVPQLKQAPEMIKYTVDLASILVGAELTSRVSAKAGDLVGRLVNLFDR